MTNAYSPEAWHELFIMLGGSIAALTGLLFVAISIRIDDVVKAPHWQIRAFSNTFALIALLIESTLILVPQSPMFLAVELLVGNTIMLIFIPARLYVRLARIGGSSPHLRLITGIAAWALGAAAGVSLLSGTGGGLYLTLVSCLTLIWVCVLNAWSLMTANRAAL